MIKTIEKRNDPHHADNMKMGDLNKLIIKVLTSDKVNNNNVN